MTGNCNFSEMQNVIWATSRQNQQNDLCAQRRLGSSWASAQSDQSLHSALLGYLSIQCFFMRTAKTLIRLGACPGWSESSLDAHAILLVLSWGGSYMFFITLLVFLELVHVSRLLDYWFLLPFISVFLLLVSCYCLENIVYIGPRTRNHITLNIRLARLCFCILDFPL